WRQQERLLRRPRPILFGHPRNGSNSSDNVDPFRADSAPLVRPQRHGLRRDGRGRIAPNPLYWPGELEGTGHGPLELHRHDGGRRAMPYGLLVDLNHLDDTMTAPVPPVPPAGWAIMPRYPPCLHA